MGCMYESSSPNVWDELSKWNPISDLSIDMIGLEHSFGNTTAMLVYVAIRINSVYNKRLHAFVFQTRPSLLQEILLLPLRLRQQEMKPQIQLLLPLLKVLTLTETPYLR